MKDAGEIMVQAIYDRAWKFGEVDPLGKPVPLERVLKVVDEDPELRLRAISGSELERGPYDGGHAVAIQTRDTPLFYMVPAEAIPLLRSYLTADDYQDLVARTPKLQRAR
ncbi:MAG: hypothetical protein M3Q29_10485 [Chloroflexota bacterium]|nr:hypothetical protein [Chloroflexota bacterium]